MFSQLKRHFSQFRVLRPDDSDFQQFGAALVGSTWRKLGERARKEFPSDITPAYLPSCVELESAVPAGFAAETFGSANLQIGICRGFNNALNGMEWHDCPEILVASTTLVLILGRVKDIENGRWSSNRATLCLVDAGQAVCLDGGTLHFAPCRTSEHPFMSVIILPRGVNGEVTRNNPADPYLWKERKWLITHPESPQRAEGAPLGIVGENIRIPTLI